MRHRHRRRLRLRLLAGRSAARAAVSPFLRSPSARLAPLQLSKWTPVGGRNSAGPLGTAGEENGAEAAARSERAGWAKPARRPGFTLAGKEPGFLAWLAETRRSSGLLARVSCAWILFRKMYFIRGVFLKALPPPCNAKCMLRGKLSSSSGLSHPKHISS